MKTIQQQKTIKVWQLLVLGVAIIWLGAMVWSIFASAAPDSTEQQKKPAFDHSQCQYPLRETNPPDGCDNSDPANPECMKGGADACATPIPTEQPDAVKPTCKG